MKTLTDIREERHMTMLDLAYLSRVSIHTICNIENSRTIPSARTIGKICSTLRIDAMDIQEFASPDRRKSATKMRALSEVGG